MWKFNIWFWKTKQHLLWLCALQVLCGTGLLHWMHCMMDRSHTMSPSLIKIQILVKLKWDNNNNCVVMMAQPSSTNSVHSPAWLQRDFVVCSTCITQLCATFHFFECGWEIVCSVLFLFAKSKQEFIPLCSPNLT